MFECSRDEGKWVPELDCDVIESPVVDARSESTILLGDEEET
jgi:hypothetical protein